jgi:hypothetical protein
MESGTGGGGIMCHSYEQNNPGTTTFGVFMDKYLAEYPIRPGEELVLFLCHDVPPRAINEYAKFRMRGFDSLPRAMRDRFNYGGRFACEVANGR